MPASVNACSNARRWESVSTVEPDLRGDHDHGAVEPVRERRRGPGPGCWSPARSARRRTTRRSPPAPATSRPCRRARRGRRRRRCSSLRSADTSPTSGRDVRGRPTQDSRFADSSSASGPHSVASWAKSFPANPSSTSAGTCVRIASAAAPVAATSRVSLTAAPSSWPLTVVDELVPRRHELLDALALEGLDHVVVVDADLGQVVHDLLRLVVLRGDLVALRPRRGRRRPAWSSRAWC